jgi:hypothetical protein
MIAITIMCNEESGDMRSAIEGIGDRRRMRVKVRRGVARCRFV